MYRCRSRLRWVRRFIWCEPQDQKPDQARSLPPTSTTTDAGLAGCSGSAKEVRNNLRHQAQNDMPDFIRLPAVVLLLPIVAGASGPPFLIVGIATPAHEAAKGRLVVSVWLAAVMT